MAKQDKKQLVIIGAGPGGYAAAFRAAELGLKVSLIDPEENPGGVCLYRGCIPSKAFLHITRTKQEIAAAEKWGLNFKEPRVDLKKMNEWKNKVVAKLTGGLGHLTGKRNIEYIRGRASFSSEKELVIDNGEGEVFSLEFENAILATGSKVMDLPGIEIDHQHIIDSTDALDLKEVPESMLIIGGGYIGLELGTVYASLGCKVSIAEMTPGFLPGTDRDLVGIFEKENKDLFEEVYFETKAEDVAVENDLVKVVLKGRDQEQQKKFHKVLVAVGRKPDPDPLHLDKAGIETDEKGFIKVNDRRQTSLTSVYAIGDLAGQPFLAHKATHEGRVAAEVIAGEAGAVYDPRSIPGIVFTHPELAWCGLTESQAKEQDMPVKVVKYPWTASGKAAMTGSENGLTKLIFDEKTGVLLGGAVAGKNAGSLIPEISLAIELGATAQEISLSIHPHPGLSETIMEAAELFFGAATHVVTETKESTT